MAWLTCCCFCGATCLTCTPSLQEMFLGWGAPKVTTRIYTDRGHNPTPDVTFKRLMLQDVPVFLTGGKQRWGLHTREALNVGSGLSHHLCPPTCKQQLF